MSPYSSKEQGEMLITVGAVCAHDRQITRRSLRYWAGCAMPFHSHGPWIHDDDKTECPEGPAKEFGEQ